MMTTYRRYRIILAILLTGLINLSDSFACLSARASSNAREVRPLEQIRMISLGFPLAQMQLEAQRINDLQLFDGKLFIGGGDAVVNTGPTDIVVYDPETASFSSEFTIDDEGIYRFRQIGDLLVIPGVDATESWDFGNVYVRQDGHWQKHRTVPRGIHVNDIVDYASAWYTATGNVFDFNGEDTYAIGAIFRSRDKGSTWEFVYGTPSDEQSVYRVGALVTFSGKLYCFVYAFSEMGPANIPERFRINGDADRNALILRDDLFGESDTLVFDAQDQQWRWVDLLSLEHVCRITPYVFGEKMLLVVLSGQYIDYLSLSDGLPAQATADFFIYDGITTKRIDLDIERIIDAVVYGASMHLLVRHKEKVFIAVSGDMEQWNFIAVPTAIKKVSALEFDGHNYYIGTADGHLYQSTTRIPVSDSGPNVSMPDKVCWSTRFASAGICHWLAVNEWEQPGVPATICASLVSNSTIEVSLDNTSSFSLFPELAGVTGEREVSVIDDNGALLFKGMVLPGHEFRIQRDPATNQWYGTRRQGSPETWKPVSEVKGKNHFEFPVPDDKTSWATWQADVLRSRLGVDIAMINKRSINEIKHQGLVSIEHLFRISSWEHVATGTISGKDLIEMLAHVATIPEDDQPVISGLSVVFADGETGPKSRIDQADIDPKRDYTVAMSGSLAKFSEDAFGRTLPMMGRTGRFTAEYLIDWLRAQQTSVP